MLAPVIELMSNSIHAAVFEALPLPRPAKPAGKRVGFAVSSFRLVAFFACTEILLFARTWGPVANQATAHLAILIFPSSFHSTSTLWSLIPATIAGNVEAIASTKDGKAFWMATSGGQVLGGRCYKLRIAGPVGDQLSQGGRSHDRDGRWKRVLVTRRRRWSLLLRRRQLLWVFRPDQPGRPSRGFKLTCPGPADRGQGARLFPPRSWTWPGSSKPSGGLKDISNYCHDRASCRNSKRILKKIANQWTR